MSFYAVFLQKYENRETVTKNKIGMNEYMNKLKEKLGKDKFFFFTSF